MTYNDDLYVSYWHENGVGAKISILLASRGLQIETDNIDDIIDFRSLIRLISFRFDHMNDMISMLSLLVTS